MNRLIASRPLAAAAALVALLGALAIHAAPAPRETFLVALSDPPLAAHVAQRAIAPGMTGPEQKRAVRSAYASVDSSDYVRRLDAAREHVLAMAQGRFGRTLTPQHVYRHAANGMALSLSADEARELAALPGVVTVRRERVLRVHTDAGPQWIGADTLWTGGISGIPATRGEGVVIGMVDTGINPTHPSFAATGGDGYHASNPRGHYYGLCTTGQAQCTAKLIGIYDFTSEGTQGVDSVGHGSHTAGIAAGNVLTAALDGYTVSLSRKVSGVAPHASLISYKACNSKPIDSSSDGTCAESSLVQAIDQATADQVDVINYSIGGPGYDPYVLLADHTTDAYAMFEARAAGIVVAVSAGNEGPGASTIDEPGNVPWVLAAANASHNRRFVNSLGGFGGAANAPATLAGQGFTSGYGPAAIVYAGDYGNALCGIGDTQGVTPNGASNPFPAGTFHGEIVICDRGTYARVEKGYNVKAGGAGGYILANTASDGEAIVSDNHFLPAVHLGYAEGQALKAWVATAGAHTGTISGVSAALDAGYGDILDATSSRGPYGFSGGVMKPDLTAPGENILSAAQTGSGLALLTGTSMASPHIAGSAALVLAAHPDWTPAQVESTLTGTAKADVRMQDGVTAASPNDAGAGRVQPAAAAQAGLYLPLNSADFFAGSGSIDNPTAHGDLSQLNRTGLENEHCFQQCGFTRTVTDLSGGGTWKVTATATAGAVVTVTPSQFTLAPGASQVLNITVDVSDPHLPGSWVSGRIVLHKTAGGRSATDMALTAAVYSEPGVAPGFQQLTADAPGGSTTINLSGLVALPQARFAVTTLAPAQRTDMALSLDPAPGSLYTFPGAGKQFVLVPNVFAQGVDTANYGRAFIAEIAASTAQRTDLFVGIDSNGNGQPDADEQVCSDSVIYGSAASARCVLDLRGAGAVNVWALVDVPQGSAGVPYSVTLNYGIPTINVVVPGGLVPGDVHVVGPGHVVGGATFPLRLFWGPAAANDASSAIAAGKYYGAVLIDAASGQAPQDLGQTAIVPFSFTRAAGGDDVADALGPALTRSFVLAPGESQRHAFIDVPANATALKVATSANGGNAGVALAFSAVRADFPSASASAQIAAAPPESPGAVSWSLGGGADLQKSVTIPVTSGRWYLVASNTGTSEATYSLSAAIQAGASQAPSLTPGNYFNPQRSGHGIFISQAGGQQVLDWYTYLEDGTPAWYVAQDAAPAAGAGAWSSTLYRVTWDGGAGTPTPVGDVVLTTTAADHAMFSYHLYGESGSEAFQLLAAPACVSAGGNANLNGEWYAPAQPGYGFDALAIPSQQFDAFYFYDDRGNPRWVVGADAPFAAAGSVPMLQSTGFCPLCAYQAITTQAAGNLTVSYAGAASGQLQSAITLNAPLSGTWNVNQPMARLTGASTCP